MTENYFGSWSVHGDVWPNGLSYCAFCDLCGSDHQHEHLVTPNAVDRYRWGLFRNARENVLAPTGIQNVVQPLADRTIEEDDEHWVRWACRLAPSPDARAVYRYIHENAWCRSQRSKRGLRRLPTHEVVARILRSIPSEPAT